MKHSHLTVSLRITATEPLSITPTWAVLQRRLFDVLDDAWREFESTYCAPDGSLVYAGTMHDRDGVDDFYEPFFNWPALYRLGGADDLLESAKHHWRGVTSQMTAFGFVRDEFEVGYDWFHLGESMIFFYAICAADPDDPEFRARAQRFAELYLPGSPSGNYNAETNTIVAPHTGSGGPRWGLGEDWREYSADQAPMKPYGLPLQDVEGIESWSDLAKPGNAAVMGNSMFERMGRGDTAVNLAATSLVTNWWLYAHDPKAASWVKTYVDGWMARADANGGVLPDNVGPSGDVGELHGGAWYGGHYGWTWPHGLLSVEAGALIAATNHYLVTGSLDVLDLARVPFDTVAERAVILTAEQAQEQVDPSWIARVGLATSEPVQVVPWRFGPQGWFDFAPPPLTFPLWMWWLSRAQPDWHRLERLEAASTFDWRSTVPFRDKEEQGHEAAWLSYLGGRNAAYPQQALELALAQVYRRLALIRLAPHGPADNDIHWWQRLNPVVTEVLTQLTTGAPPALYNGGLTFASVVYGDGDRGRPGLPNDVAALVTALDGDSIELELVNVSVTESRNVIVQSGAFAEDRIDNVTYTVFSGGYPGDSYDYQIPPTPTSLQSAPNHSARIAVELPPLSRVSLRLLVSRGAFTASHTSFSHDSN